MNQAIAKLSASKPELQQRLAARQATAAATLAARNAAFAAGDLDDSTYIGLCQENMRAARQVKEVEDKIATVDKVAALKADQKGFIEKVASVSTLPLENLTLYLAEQRYDADKDTQIDAILASDEPDMLKRVRAEKLLN